ncbi:hypothetical protein D3C73_1381580 [compost metagenome]
MVLPVYPENHSAMARTSLDVPEIAEPVTIVAAPVNRVKSIGMPTKFINGFPWT